AAAGEGQNRKVIGVDVDQSAESPLIITSAMKGLTVSVKLALASYYANDGAWDVDHAGKTETLGAAEDAVGLPTATDSWRMTEFTVADYTTLFNTLKAGTVVVDNSITTAPTTVKVVVDYQNEAE
ncbi:MAG: BMP family ABC transporter substrate-binding protein, partial [Clostridia bacterium]|nr:BMP family ABC transporter substrate-binding protein [Clostridia bacterium]